MRSTRLPLMRELSSETRLRERKTAILQDFRCFSPSVTAAPCHLPHQREVGLVQISLVRQHLFCLFPIFLGGKIQSNGFYLGMQLFKADTGGFQHPLGCQSGHGICVFI